MRFNWRTLGCLKLGSALSAAVAISISLVLPPLPSLALHDDPIPRLRKPNGTALSYHDQPVDLSQPLSLEPLVKASDLGLSSKSYYYIADGTNTPYKRRIPGALADVWLRKSVADKLVAVNRELAPLDLEVHIFDGYRPIETQQALWQHFIEKGRQQLKTSDERKLKTFAGKFASDPTGFKASDSKTWPTHNTGGAVDLTLRKKSSGELLDMGGGFDDASSISFTDALETNTNTLSARKNAAARNNRRTLYNAMTKAGFVNYPYEWWHFDYGTQMWIQNTPKASELPVVPQSRNNNATNASKTTNTDNATNTNKAWYGPATLPK